MMNTNKGAANDAGQMQNKSGRADAGVANLNDVREHMDVIASCGTKIGVVDHVDGNAIKLTKKDSKDGQHHWLPKSMIDHVDQHVHLNRNSEQAYREWRTDAASCGSCG
jgi:hypothetical protein